MLNAASPSMPKWPLWIVCEWSWRTCDLETSTAEFYTLKQYCGIHEKNMGEDGIWEVHDEKKRFIDNLRTTDTRNIPHAMDFFNVKVLTGNNRRWSFHENTLPPSWFENSKNWYHETSHWQYYSFSVSSSLISVSTNTPWRNYCGD